MKASILIWPLMLAVFVASGAWFLINGIIESNRDSAIVGGLQLGFALAGWAVIRRYGIRVERIENGVASVRTYSGRHSLILADVEAIFPTSNRNRTVIAIRSGPSAFFYILRGAPGLRPLVDAVRRENSQSDIRDF